MAEQAQALKAEAPVGTDVYLVSNRVWQISLLSIAALCDGLQAIVGSMLGPTLPLSTEEAYIGSRL